MCYLVFIKINIFCSTSTSETRVEWINAIMVLHYCDVGILLVLSQWIERYLRSRLFISIHCIMLNWSNSENREFLLFVSQIEIHIPVSRRWSPEEKLKWHRSDKTRWKSNSFYDLSHPPDICRADGWWDWMSDEGLAGTCWPTISYLCSCRSVRIFPCVLWMWHDSDPNPKQRWRVLDLWCLEARKEREKLRCWKRNLVSGLEGAADLICWSPPRTPGGHGAADVSTLDVLLTPTT